MFVALSRELCGRFRDLNAAYAKLATRTTLYISKADLAIKVLRWLHGSPRAGLTPPTLVLPDIDTINVTNAALTKLGHGYVAEAERVLRDMYELIRRNAPPSERFLQSDDNEEGQLCWMIRA